MIDGEHWQQRLTALCAQHRVPGAALGILRLNEDCGRDLVALADGVLNSETGVPATPDSLFQIGSISKVWTATVVMQLVDEGLVELGTLVRDILPDVDLGSAELTATVTVRHLLTHTSGIGGDLFADTGRGEDCLARYVGLLAGIAPSGHPGEMFSYCNSGWVVLGRVIEVLTGLTWDEAMRARIITPLGLEHTVTLPEEALLFRAAVGHLIEDGSPVLVRPWGLPRSLGPAGLIVASVADLLAFASLQMTGGYAPDGTRLLSAASSKAMAAHQQELPHPSLHGESWGLGWARFSWDGTEALGHDGGTIGQCAFLRVVPSRGLAIALLTNSADGGTSDVFDDLCREIAGELIGVTPAPQYHPTFDGALAEHTKHVGVYERVGGRFEIMQRPAGLTLRVTLTGDLAEVDRAAPTEIDLAHVAGDSYALQAQGERGWSPVDFVVSPSGQSYLHLRLRAAPKVVG